MFTKDPTIPKVEDENWHFGNCSGYETTTTSTTTMKPNITESNANAKAIPNSEPINANMIIGAIIPILIVSVIVISVGTFLYKRRKPKPKHTSNEMSEMESLIKDYEHLVKTFLLKMANEEIPTLAEFEDLVDLDQRRNVSKCSSAIANVFTDHNRYYENCYYKFICRYIIICTNGKFAIFFFFRYGPVVPYDKNRVKLNKPIKDIDYVNASWITGNREIAAQGPMPETTVYFLQMLVDHGVEAIVNLTKCKEKRKNGTIVYKSTQYWPSSVGDGEPINFGHMEVKTIKEEKLNDEIVIKRLEVLSK